MNKNKKTVIKKVRPLGNLTDIYYISSTDTVKNIDGVDFLAVTKLNPEEYPMKTLQVHWMRKDNLETVK